jgi:hypothetical protein
MRRAANLLRFVARFLFYVVEENGMDSPILAQVLVWVVSGGGSTVVTYWVMEELMEPDMSPKTRRYASLAMAIAIAWAAVLIATGMGYREGFADWRAVIEELFAVAFLAVGGSQWLHGKRRLSGGHV